MAATRRIGAEDSATRAAMLDAAEQVMREHGYGALTCRRVADHAGVKQQLIYYYFRSMDELMLAAHQRRIDETMAQIEAATRASRPLHAIWAMANDEFNMAINMEYLALANHNELIRERIIKFGEEVRGLQINALPELPEGFPFPPDVFTPTVMTMLIHSIAGMIGLQSSIGLTRGHDELRQFVTWWLDQVEPEE